MAASIIEKKMISNFLTYFLGQKSLMSKETSRTSIFLSASYFDYSQNVSRPIIYFTCLPTDSIAISLQLIK